MIKSKEEIEKLNKEKETLLKQFNVFNQSCDEIKLRLAEIQGVIKFLEEKSKEDK